MNEIYGFIIDNTFFIGELKEKQEEVYVFTDVFLLVVGVSQRGLGFNFVPFAKTMWVSKTVPFFEPEQVIIDAYRNSKIQKAGIYLGTPADLEIKKDN
jgi:hypothetical protein